MAGLRKGSRFGCMAEALKFVKDKVARRERMTRDEYRDCMTANGAYPKDASLAYWAGLEPDQPVLPEFVPIPAKSSGSSYGACGIRIDGTPEFIDAVLSRLQDLLDGEGMRTRLELSRSQVKAREINGSVKRFDKAGAGAEVCYIRLHERGREAQIAHAIFASVSDRGGELFD